MKNLKLLLFAVLCFCSNLSIAQSNKATLYIVRTSGLGAAVNFKYFIGDQFIGKTNFGKYFKLDLDEGEYLIWAKSENRSFVKANLKAGNTYVLNALPQMGAFKAGVYLKAINNPTEKELIKIKKYIAKKKLLVYDEKKKMLEQKDYASLIEKGLKLYNEKVVNSPDLETLNVPIDL